MTIAACFLLLVPLPCRQDSDKTQICESYKLVFKKTYDNMTIPACFLVIVLLPCRPDSDNTQICEFYKIAKHAREYHDLCVFIACGVPALACSWPALYGVRLASFWPSRSTSVVFSARLSCSVWLASGSLSWACVVWVCPAVPGPRPKIVSFL